MCSTDRDAADLELTPIFASICEQLGMRGGLTAAGDAADGDSNCGHCCGSLGVEVEIEQLPTGS